MHAQRGSGMRPPILLAVLTLTGLGACAFAGGQKHSNKLLDGVALKGVAVPDYLRIEPNNLQKPAAVAHVTCNLGTAFEKPERVVLTRSGAVMANQWDADVFPAGLNAALVLFWDPREIKPGGQRKLAYGFGQGIALPPGGEGAFALALSGSFAPGKLFTIAAQVRDPALGQSLTLALPDGVQRVEGKERQPVPAVDAEGRTLVLWKARILRPGRFDLRVRSSTGITHSKIVTITRS